MKAVLCAAAVSLLAGCQTVPVPVCPSIVEYTPETQRAALAELQRLGKHSTLGRFMVDYKQIRDKLRSCRGD